jgi:hypothetical protein
MAPVDKSYFLNQNTQDGFAVHSTDNAINHHMLMFIIWGISFVIKRAKNVAEHRANCISIKLHFFAR